MTAMSILQDASPFMPEGLPLGIKLFAYSFFANYLNKVIFL